LIAYSGAKRSVVPVKAATPIAQKSPHCQIIMESSNKNKGLSATVRGAPTPENSVKTEGFEN
jgi:hypothetical protein